MKKFSVLFVCLGNICRSPSAEGVFRARLEHTPLAEHVQVDSAGTAAWHVGKAPDARSQAAALRRGYDLSALRARQVSVDDFHRFDFLFAMDDDNLARLRAMQPAGSRARLSLFLDLVPKPGVREVPDPYYGGEAGFERVLDLLEAASDALVAHLQRECA